MKTNKGKTGKIRMAICAFIILLVLSGLTAFPLRTGAAWLASVKSIFPEAIQKWVEQINTDVSRSADIVLYGTDWLAFAHLVIALFFIPVYIDPPKYKMNLQMGMIACAGVFPLAFICGAIRGIPFFHQLIDCSFGLIGGLLLLFIYRQIAKPNLSNVHSHA